MIKATTAPLLSIFVIALSANLPIPLFPLYAQTYGFSDFALTALFSLYGLAIFVSLLISTSLSEKLGLEMMVLISLIIVTLTTLLFYLASSPLQVFVARCLTGAAVGLFMGAGNSLLIKRAPDRQARLSQLANIITILGFGISPLVSALWAEFSFQDAMQTPYLIFLMMLAITLLLHIKTTPAGDFSAKRSSFQLSLKVGYPPDSCRAFFVFVCPCIFIMFSLNGMLISLLPSFMFKIVNSDNLLWSGVLIFVLLVGGAIAQHLPWVKTKESRAFVGIFALAFGACLFMVAGSLMSIKLLILSVIIQALGSGWTFQGSFLLASGMTKDENRVGILSTFYLSGYLGTVLVPILTGALTKAFELFISMGLIIAFEVLLVMFVMFNYRLIRNPQT